MILFLMTCFLAFAILIPLGFRCRRIIMELEAGEKGARRKLVYTASLMGAAILILWSASFLSVRSINDNPGASWLATQEHQERHLLRHIVGADTWDEPPSYKYGPQWTVNEAYLNTVKKQREYRD